jgi:hypothetical protein
MVALAEVLPILPGITEATAVSVQFASFGGQVELSLQLIPLTYKDF